MFTVPYLLLTFVALLALLALAVLAAGPCECQVRGALRIGNVQSDGREGVHWVAAWLVGALGDHASDNVRLSRPAASEMAALYADYNHHEDMCNRTHSHTMVVAGFPFHAVQGHGGFSDYLPAERGLWFLLANTLCFLVAGVVGARQIPRTIATPVLWASIVVAIVATGRGMRCCVYYWD